MDAQREEHRPLGRGRPRLLTRRKHLCPGPEDPFGFAAGLLEDLGRLPRLRDRPHRLDERVQEARLRDELALGGPMPPALGVEDRPGAQARGRDRPAQGDPPEPLTPGREGECRHSDTGDDGNYRRGETSR